MASVERLLADADQCLERDDAAAGLVKAKVALDAARELGHAGQTSAAVCKVALATAAAGKHDDAVALANEELGRVAGEAAPEARLRIALAELQQAAGALEEALASAATAQQLLRGAGGALAEPALLGEALLLELNVQLRRGERRRADPQQCFQRAVDLGKEALECFQAAGDVRGQAIAMHGVGAARICLRSFESGIRAAKDALRLWQTLDSARAELFELQSIATWYLQAGQPQQALPFASEALELAREEQCGARCEASAVQVMVQALVACRQHDAARRMGSDAVTRFQQSGSRRGEAVASNAVLLTHMARGDPWQGLQVARQALAAFADVGDIAEQVALLRTIARMNLQMQRWDEAVDAARQALLLSHDSPRGPQDRIECMNLLVELQTAGRLHKDAVQTVEDEREHWSDADARREEGLSLLSLASVLLKSKGAQDAIYSAEDAQALFEEVEDRAGEAAAMQLLALCHLSEGSLKEALDVLRQGVKLLQQAGDRKGEVGNLMLIAQVHELSLAAGKHDPAARPFREEAVVAVQAAKDAAALATKLGDRHLAAAAQCLLSRLWHLASRGSEAAQAAKVAAVTYRELGDRHGEASALLLSAGALAAASREQPAQDAAGKALMLFRQLGDGRGERRAEQVLDEIGSRAAEEEAAQQAARPAEQPLAKMLPDVAVAQPSVDVDAISAKVKSTVMGLVGVEDLEGDTPLMMAGLTSQSAVLLRKSLVQEMKVDNLPHTMMFDFPSISALTDFFVARG